MILDRENIFCELSSAPTAAVLGDAIAYCGDVRNPMFLYIGPGLASGSATVALETSDKEDFSAATTLATYVAGTEPVKALLPLGVKKYLRLKGTGVSTPVLKAGTKFLGALVVDVDVK